LIWHIPENENLPNTILVDVLSDPDLYVNCCDLNTDLYLNKIGNGEKIEGCYVLKHNSLNLYQLIKHYIVKIDGCYLDITPFEDTRVKNVFSFLKLNTRNMYCQSPEFINNNIIQEKLMSYYVYCYIDPDTEIPFYVGKGTKDRDVSHLKNAGIKNTHFYNKIAKLKRQEKEPIIVRLAEDIEDEKLAYDIEASFIKDYGRKNIDKNGVLLNI
jgi:hypothetical protein